MVWTMEGEYIIVQNELDNKYTNKNKISIYLKNITFVKKNCHLSGLYVRVV